MNNIQIDNLVEYEQHIELMDFDNMLDSLAIEHYEEYLWSCISILRDQLLEVSKEKGLIHKDTLRVSRELDEVIIHYQKLKQLF